MSQKGEEISWKTVNGVARGTVVDVSVSYLVRLQNGKQVIVNERSIIKSNQDDITRQNRH